MTRQEADALKTYIDFMAEQTAGPIKITEEAAAAFKEAIVKDFDKSREGFDIGAGIIFDSNPLGGHWVEEAGPIYPKVLANLKPLREGFPNFKNKPTHFATWNEPQDANPYIMRTYSFAEFKEFETFPDKCQVYAHKDLKAEIIKFAENLGYTVSAEVPRSECASILEFIMGDEPQYISIEDLINKYFTSQNTKYNIFDTRSISEVLTSQFVEVAKLVRTLTIAEYKGDGCYEAEPNNIKLPKDFTL